MPPRTKSKIADKIVKTAKVRKTSSASALSRAVSRNKSKAASRDGMAASTASKEGGGGGLEGEAGPVYFWRPHEEHGYLGQWYESEFEHEGATYATAEMWMMVGKARLFGDEAVAQKMLATTDPKAHKGLGRSVKNFSERTWEAEKLRIVEEGNYLKFTRAKGAEEMRALLLGTGSRELVEASPLDKVWGIGFGAKNAARNRERWGRNLLGVALMNVRERLRSEEAEGKGKGKVEGEEGV